MPLGNVAKKANQTGAAMIENPLGTDVRPEYPAVLSQHGQIFTRLQPAFHLGLESLHDGRHVRRRMDVGCRQGLQFVHRIAQHRADRGVGTEESPRFHVGNQKPIRHSIVDRLQLGVTLPERLFGLLLLVNVVEEAGHS